jgi:WD40 repeat protein
MKPLPSTPPTKTQRLWRVVRRVNVAVSAVAFAWVVCQRLGEKLAPDWQPVTPRVQSLSFTPDSQTLIGAGADKRPEYSHPRGHVLAWDTGSGALLWRAQAEYPVGNLAVASLNGKGVVATASADVAAPRSRTIVSLRDSRSGATRWTVSLDGLYFSQAHLSFSPDGQSLAVSRPDGATILDVLHRGRTVRQLTREPDAMGDVVSAQFGPGGKTLVVNYVPKDADHPKSGVDVWDATTGKTLYSPEPPTPGYVFAELSPDRTRLLTGVCNEDAARLWDPRTDRLLGTLKRTSIEAGKGRARYTVAQIWKARDVKIVESTTAWLPLWTATPETYQSAIAAAQIGHVTAVSPDWRYFGTLSARRRGRLSDGSLPVLYNVASSGRGRSAYMLPIP